MWSGGKGEGEEPPIRMTSSPWGNVQLRLRLRRSQMLKIQAHSVPSGRDSKWKALRKESSWPWCLEQSQLRGKQCGKKSETWPGAELHSPRKEYSHNFSCLWKGRRAENSARIGSVAWRCVKIMQSRGQMRSSDTALTLNLSLKIGHHRLEQSHLANLWPS